MQGLSRLSLITTTLGELMAFGDFINRMTSTDRLKASQKSIRKSIFGGSIGGLSEARDVLQRSGEDIDTLFMGAEPEPYTPPVAEPTLKSAESRAADEQTKRRRPASNMTKNPLSTKTVLGG